MVNMLFLFAVLFCVYKSFIQLFKLKERRGTYISFENIAFLFFLYVNVSLGFGLVYMLFEMSGIPVLLDNGSELAGSYLEKIGESMYFSSITLLSVGYGDITPIGVGRWFAILEALIGYIIPAAFVVRSMMDYDQG